VKSILDPSFQYVPSHLTDIGKTFERVRQAAEDAKKQRDQETGNVRAIFDQRRLAEANDDRR